MNWSSITMSAPCLAFMIKSSGEIGAVPSLLSMIKPSPRSRTALLSLLSYDFYHKHCVATKIHPISPLGAVQSTSLERDIKMFLEDFYVEDTQTYSCPKLHSWQLWRRPPHPISQHPRRSQRFRMAIVTVPSNANAALSSLLLYPSSWFKQHIISIFIPSSNLCGIQPTTYLHLQHQRLIECKRADQREMWDKADYRVNLRWFSFWILTVDLQFIDNRYSAIIPVLWVGAQTAGTIICHVLIVMQSTPHQRPENGHCKCHPHRNQR